MITVTDRILNGQLVLDDAELDLPENARFTLRVESLPVIETEQADDLTEARRIVEANRGHLRAETDLAAPAQGFGWDDYNFDKAREMTRHIGGNWADDLIEDRDERF